MIYYDKNQEYRQHYDGWLFDNSEKSRRNMKWGGQRIWTCIRIFKYMSQKEEEQNLQN